MAQRFGGKYSPDGSQTSASGKTVANMAPALSRPHPVGARVNLLFVLPFAFAIRAFFNDPGGLALNLGAFALLMGAAWLTREGVLAHAAYDARKIARRPAIPRKIFASVLTGAGLGLAALPGGIMAAGIIGVIGALLHFGAFGADPLADKGVEGVGSFENDRAARAIDEAEAHLSAMTDAIQRCRDRGLAKRLHQFAATIRPLFQTVENDPRHLSAARRYLGIYLQGARDATEKFADLYARTRDADARRDFEHLLDDLETRFALRRETLLANDRQALDIEMDVLRERLEREGLRPAPDIPADGAKD